MFYVTTYCFTTIACNLPIWFANFPLSIRVKTNPQGLLTKNLVFHGEMSEILAQLFSDDSIQASNF